MAEGLKIIFAGTPHIASTVLAKILEHKFKIDLVLTQPDRPAGRGMLLTPSPVKQVAEQAGCEIFQPLNFRKNPEALAKIRAMQPDILVVVAYGLILPQELLDIPRLGCINLHVSLLPRWRGAAPIQRAILAGDEYSGVSIMQMDAGLDTGAILMLEKVKLAADETSASLYARMAEIGAAKIVEFLAQPEVYTPEAQASTGISYAPKISKEEALINWSEPAEIIERKIRGYNSFPGAYTFLAGKLHKIWQAKISSLHSQSQAGTILNVSKELLVSCGNGSVLAITEIQEAGAKRKAIQQFLNGKSGLAGSHFSTSAGS